MIRKTDEERSNLEQLSVFFQYYRTETLWNSKRFIFIRKKRNVDTLEIYFNFEAKAVEARQTFLKSLNNIQLSSVPY